VKLICLFFIHLTPLLRVSAYSLFLLLCTACSTLPTDSYSPSSPMDDAKYQPILEKWRKSVSTYKDLELRVRASAVLVSPEMEESYRTRLSEIQGAQAKVDNKIVMSKNTVSVVVEVFTKTEAFFDLADDNLWSLSLTIQGKPISPNSINRYRKKELLVPFFPLSTDWSRFYIVVFKLPYELLKEGEVKEFFQKKESQPDLPPGQDRTIVFSMNSGETQAKFSWDP
jgi:hypothetical protein